MTQKDDGLLAQMLLLLASTCSRARFITVHGDAQLGPLAAAALSRFRPRERLGVMVAAPLEHVLPGLPTAPEELLAHLALSLNDVTEPALPLLASQPCCVALTLLRRQGSFGTDLTAFLSALASNTALQELDVSRIAAPLDLLFSAVSHSRLRVLTVGIGADWSGLAIAAECTTLHTLRLCNLGDRAFNEPLDFGRLDALFGVDLYSEIEAFPQHFADVDDDDDGEAYWHAWTRGRERCAKRTLTPRPSEGAEDEWSRDDGPSAAWQVSDELFSMIRACRTNLRVLHVDPPAVVEPLFDRWAKLQCANALRGPSRQLAVNWAGTGGALLHGMLCWVTNVRPRLTPVALALAPELPVLLVLAIFVELDVPELEVRSFDAVMWDAVKVVRDFVVKR